MSLNTYTSALHKIENSALDSAPSSVQCRALLHDCGWYGREAVFMAPVIAPIWTIKEASGHFGRAINNGLDALLKTELGSRPSIRAAAAIEAALWWTPDPTSEIVALSLAGWGLSVCGAEKGIGCIINKVSGESARDHFFDSTDKISDSFYEAAGNVLYPKAVRPLTSKMFNNLKNSSSLRSICMAFSSGASKIKDQLNDLPTAHVFGMTF